MTPENKAFYTVPWIALVIGILCIGLSAIFVKLANVPGSVSSFYRLFFAALAITPLWIYKGMKIPPVKDLWLISKGSFFFSIDFVLWNTALLITSAATATLLANNAPLWVGLLSFLFLNQHPGKKFWIGLLISMGGMYVLLGRQLLDGTTINQGDILALVAGFFYALYIMYTVEVRKKVDTVTFMMFSVAFMTIILFIVNLFFGHPLTGFSTKTWASLAAMGLISHFTGWMSINYALGHLKGTNVSASLLAQAVVTAILGIIILGESLSFFQLAGGSLVLVGIYVVNRRK